MRQCGDCQLCCKLLPVPPLQKKAGQRCKFQKFGKGCTVYHTTKMPVECGVWNCRWLVNDDTDDLARPDRAHYVIDLMPDFITVRPDAISPPLNIQVVQIWIDPNFPDAHRDPALRRYMVRRAQDGIATLIRFDARKALTIFPPPFDEQGEWHEIAGTGSEKTHSLDDTLRALAKS